MNDAGARQTFVDRITDYVGFTEADSAILNKAKPDLEPSLDLVADHFYDAIDRSDEARSLLSGRAQIERLKRTFRAWLSSGLAGPHDEAFFEGRAQVGRTHVRVGLPQHFMVTSMNGVRRDLHGLAGALDWTEEARGQLHIALDRWLDLELVIMLQSYKQDSDARLARTERLAAMGELAGTIAHELRNPLGVIESSIFLLKKGETDAGAKRHLQRIGDQVHACSGIITDLLDLVRDHPPRKKRVGVRDLVVAAAADVSIPDDITLSIEIPPDLQAAADPGLLKRALFNLVENSVAAMRDRAGTIVVNGGIADDGRLQISVWDDGPGFDDDLLPRVFEPLVSGKPAGVGLGLALVLRVVERHGGIVRAGNREGGGAFVELVLPGEGE